MQRGRDVCRAVASSAGAEEFEATCSRDPSLPAAIVTRPYILLKRGMYCDEYFRNAGCAAGASCCNICGQRQLHRPAFKQAAEST